MKGDCVPGQSSAQHLAVALRGWGLGAGQRIGDSRAENRDPASGQLCVETGAHVLCLSSSWVQWHSLSIVGEAYF